MRIFGFYQQYSDADGFYSCEECGAAPRQPCDKDCPIRLMVEEHDHPPVSDDDDNFPEGNHYER